jgi:hypothetical protein
VQLRPAGKSHFNCFNGSWQKKRKTKTLAARQRDQCRRPDQGNPVMKNQNRVNRDSRKNRSISQATNRSNQPERQPAFLVLLDSSGKEIDRIPYGPGWSLTVVQKAAAAEQLSLIEYIGSKSLQCAIGILGLAYTAIGSDTHDTDSKCSLTHLEALAQRTCGFIDLAVSKLIHYAELSEVERAEFAAAGYQTIAWNIQEDLNSTVNELFQEARIAKGLPADPLTSGSKL